MNSYQYLKNKNSLNYEIIENINSIFNFNDIKFTMDKNFNCLTRLIYINGIIKLEYNTLFKRNKNFINFDLQITKDEEKLIHDKNINSDLQFKKFVDKNYDNTYYGYVKYDPDGGESKYKVEGFGIKIDKNSKYIGEFKDGSVHGYGVYYLDSGGYEYRKDDDSTEAFKHYDRLGSIETCIYYKIVDKYQKYGLSFKEMLDGTKKIRFVKNNNFDDYGIIYNINGELYEGYHLNGVKHGYGILSCQIDNKIQKGLFVKDRLKFGRKEWKNWVIEGEFKMGLKVGYIIKYDELKRKKFEGEYKNGKKEGFGINYYDNGNIKYKGFFRNDLEDIFGFFYNFSGKVYYVGHLDKGQKKGFGIYYVYDQEGNKLYQYSGNWVDDDKCDGYLLKKFPDGDYFFGFTKMFVYQNFLKFKEGEKIYIGETKIKSSSREGYGETIYPNGTIEKGIYINDHLVLK